MHRRRQRREGQTCARLDRVRKQASRHEPDLLPKSARGMDPLCPQTRIAPLPVLASVPRVSGSGGGAAARLLVVEQHGGARSLRLRDTAPEVGEGTGRVLDKGTGRRRVDKCRQPTPEKGLYVPT